MRTTHSSLLLASLFFFSLCYIGEKFHLPPPASPIFCRRHCLSTIRFVLAVMPAAPQLVPVKDTPELLKLFEIDPRARQILKSDAADVKGAEEDIKKTIPLFSSGGEAEVPFDIVYSVATSFMMMEDTCLVENGIGFLKELILASWTVRWSTVVANRCDAIQSESSADVESLDDEADGGDADAGWRDGRGSHSPGWSGLPVGSVVDRATAPPPSEEDDNDGADTDDFSAEQSRAPNTRLNRSSSSSSHHSQPPSSSNFSFQDTKAMEAVTETVLSATRRRTATTASSSRRQRRKDVDNVSYAHYYIALGYVKLGRLDKSCAHVQQALLLAPTSNRARVLHSYLESIQQNHLYHSFFRFYNFFSSLFQRP